MVDWVGLGFMGGSCLDWVYPFRRVVLEESGMPYRGCVAGIFGVVDPARGCGLLPRLLSLTRTAPTSTCLAPSPIPIHPSENLHAMSTEDTDNKIHQPRLMDARPTPDPQSRRERQHCRFFHQARRIGPPAACEYGRAGEVHESAGGAVQGGIGQAHSG